MAPNTDDLLKISPCLTADYLSQRLTEWFGKDIEYTGHTYGDGTQKDIYLNEIYPLSFRGKVKSPKSGENPEVLLRVILKSFTKNLFSHFYVNEIIFYTRVLPRLLAFQPEKKMTNPFKNCPKVFASLMNGENEFLALEDMTEHGFVSLARPTGLYLDLENGLTILRNLAKFHALSFAFKDQHPEEYEKLANSLTNKNKEPTTLDKNYWEALCIFVIDVFEKEYPNTIYLKKIKEFATEKTFDFVSRQSNSNVFVYGKSWIPNFLLKFKNDGESIDEVMIIDFQLASSASCVHDVLYCIHNNNHYSHPHNYDIMLSYYYNTLASQIREMGSDPEEVYSREYFTEEIRSWFFFRIMFHIKWPVTTPWLGYDIKGMWPINPIKLNAETLRAARTFIFFLDCGCMY